MHIINSFNELTEHLTRYFPENQDNQARIVGLLFAQPTSFTNEEIFSQIDYFHNRSGSNIDFFCVGYQPHDSNENKPISVTVADQNWHFDSNVFNNFRRELENKTKWRYSGGVELVLFDTYLKNTRIVTDFSDSISINLQKIKNITPGSSIGELFENIFRIAESIDNQNPSREMSAKLIAITGKNSIVNILINLIPESIRNFVEKIYSYGTENRNS